MDIVLQIMVQTFGEKDLSFLAAHLKENFAHPKSHCEKYINTTTTIVIVVCACPQVYK